MKPQLSRSVCPATTRPLGALAAGLAHDLNNLMQIVLSGCELARLEAGSQAGLAGALARIEDAAMRATGVASAVLDVARNRAPTAQLVDVVGHVEALTPLLRSAMPHDIRIHSTPAARRARIRVSPSRLDQLLLNLCTNASHAIDGIGRIDIELSGGPPGYLRLRVCDDGRGMSPQQLRAISGRRAPGRGIGYSIILAVVEELAGRLSCESRPGGGSRVTVLLPLASGSPPRDILPPTSERE